MWITSLLVSNNLFAHLPPLLALLLSQPFSADDILLIISDTMMLNEYLCWVIVPNPLIMSLQQIDIWDSLLLVL